MVGYNIKIMAAEPNEVAKDALRLYYKFCHFLSDEDVKELEGELTEFLAKKETEAGAPEAAPTTVEEPEMVTESEPTPVEEPVKEDHPEEIDKTALRKMLIRVRDKCGSEVVNMLYEKHANGASSVGKVDPACYSALYYAAKEYADAAH